MSNDYQAVFRQANALRRRFGDLVDAPNDPEAKALHRGLDNLAEEFEKQTNPRSLEHMAKRLAEEFKHANNQSTHIMDPRHLNEFKNKLEEIAHEVGKL